MEIAEIFTQEKYGKISIFELESSDFDIKDCVLVGLQLNVN
jgi:hypothetical protein